MSSTCLRMPPETSVADALRQLRSAGIGPTEAVSYIYVVAADGTLLGVVDLRGMVTGGRPGRPEGHHGCPRRVAWTTDTLKDDMAELFAKYHFRMLPVVDAKDHLLGVIHYNDIMKGLVTRARFLGGG